MCLLPIQRGRRSNRTSTHLVFSVLNGMHKSLSRMCISQTCCFILQVEEQTENAFGKTLLGAPGIATRNKDATRNKCIATTNKCLASSNKKLLVTSASLLVTSASLLLTSALLVVTRSC